jgi:EF hand
MKTHIQMVSSLVLVAGAAFAGDQMKEQTFTDLDQNKDGVLTQQEASVDDNLIAQFAQIDTNRDGTLSASEYDQYTDETEEGE